MQDRRRLRRQAALHVRRREALHKIQLFSIQLAQVFVMPALIGLFFYNFLGLDLKRVNLALAVQGRVTKCDVNRQHFNWYLNHDESTRYDFWAFEPGDAATQRLITADSLEFIVATGDTSGYTYYNTLAYYLRTGARLHKSAHSPYVHVVQDHRRTRWKYRP